MCTNRKELVMTQDRYDTAIGLMPDDMRVEFGYDVKIVTSD